MDSFIFSANETPEQAAMRKRQMVASALTQQPQNVGQGLSAIGQALMSRSSQFPSAPGGATPSLATRFGNIFGMGGGLY